MLPLLLLCVFSPRTDPLSAAREPSLCHSRSIHISYRNEIWPFRSCRTCKYACRPQNTRKTWKPKSVSADVYFLACLLNLTIQDPRSGRQEERRALGRADVQREKEKNDDDEEYVQRRQPRHRVCSRLLSPGLLDRRFRLLEHGVLPVRENESRHMSGAEKRDVGRGFIL